MVIWSFSAQGTQPHRWHSPLPKLRLLQGLRETIKSKAVSPRASLCPPRRLYECYTSVVDCFHVWKKASPPPNSRSSFPTQHLSSSSWLMIFYKWIDSAHTRACWPWNSIWGECPGGTLTTEEVRRWLGPSKQLPLRAKWQTGHHASSCLLLQNKSFPDQVKPNPKLVPQKNSPLAGVTVSKTPPWESHCLLEASNFKEKQTSCCQVHRDRSCIALPGSSAGSRSSLLLLLLMPLPKVSFFY